MYYITRAWSLAGTGEREPVFGPKNYGCENKHNQWVVYHGKTADEIQAGATVDLTQDDAMAKAAADAEALCAPLSLG